MDVLNCKKDDGRVSMEIKGDDGKTRNINLSAVRGGLTWPEPESPAYFVMVGVERKTGTRFEGKPKPKSRYIFLTEQEIPGLILEPLFRSMTDAATRFYSSEIFAPIDEGREETAKFYDHWCWEHGIRYGYIMPAPFWNEASLGVSLVSKAINNELLDLPRDSIIRRQLQSLSSQDLTDLNNQHFYAVNAARALFAGFYKYPPSNHSNAFTPNRTGGGFIPNRKRVRR